MVGPQTSTRRIVVLTIILLIFGVVMLFSASGIMGIQRHENEFYFITRQGGCALIGLALMFLLSRVPADFWNRASPYIFALQIVLIGLTFIPHFRIQAQGASRWLKLGGITLQPSELARISVTLYMARIMSESEKCGFHYRQWLLHAGLLAGLLLMIFKQNDLGSPVILLSIILGILFVSGIKPVLFLGMVGTGAASAVIAMLGSEYRRRRLTAFLNPWSDPQGAGFQSIQSMLSIHSGKVTGVGIGNGNSKLFYLPEVHTDFIFSLTAEELGLLGAGMILVLFAALGFVLFRAASKMTDSFPRYVVFGLSLSLMLQVCVNVGGVTGLVPAKGLPLPFFSWGRSALLTHLATVGIILACIRNSAQRPAKLNAPTLGNIQRELLNIARPGVR
ncbi:MAG: putative lipid II flippase FtsW [Deltaproteobacteria bacterium]|nr:putative lipid II flippase FtsW [Deltaproteobacteria bacterium]MBI3294753.1 putative lipid II flippase FtsW [Deltaproteobacteria bacterium]